MWAYSRSRAVRDTKTLTAQENRARDVITGGKAARIPRFVKTAKNGFVLDETALAAPGAWPAFKACRFPRVSRAGIGCPDVGFAVVVRLVIV